jgi:CspA family cold shock protein
MSSYKDTVTPSEHLTGRVKWFNNKAGYGFVTVTDGVRSGTDVFVHHSDINVESQQYKYLVQGEYIEFDLIKVESGKHEWQASHVSGIRGGKLMCETRLELKIARTEYKAVKSVDEPVIDEPVVDEPVVDEPKIPRQKSVSHEQRKRAPPRGNSRVRGEGPRDSDSKKEWTLVGNKARDTRQRNSHSNKVTSKQGSTIITIQSK